MCGEHSVSAVVCGSRFGSFLDIKDNLRFEISYFRYFILTIQKKQLPQHTPSFNPRPREGGDKAVNSIAEVPVWFQSTPPRRGRRRSPLTNFSASCSFNPRPREGGDTTWKRIPNPTMCFNPRPREGGDARTGRPNKPRPMFQSTPPRRGRLGLLKMNLMMKQFQSTPPRRGRRSPSTGFTDPGSFNPRPREGGDVRIRSRAASYSVCFNPRPREGGDSLCL